MSVKKASMVQTDPIITLKIPKAPFESDIFFFEWPGFNNL